MNSISDPEPAPTSSENNDTREVAIQIYQLRKTFTETEFVLDGVDLDIFKGKITCIIGFSGTGKSVLLKHILGLLWPTSGRVKVFDTDLIGMTQEELIRFRCHFGMLFQNAALFDDMTTLQNVCFPLVEHRKDLSRRRIEAIARSRLEMVGLDTKHFNKLPMALSGGMRKRVGLARAIALDPDILIFDEPTTGLDPILTEMVDDLILKTHNRRPGITSVMVSHDLTAAFRIADYVAMLDSGKILLYGTTEDFHNSEIPLVRRFVSKGVRNS